MGFLQKKLNFTFIKAKWICVQFFRVTVTEIAQDILNQMYDYYNSTYGNKEHLHAAAHWTLWKWNELYSLILWGLAYRAGTKRRFRVQHGACDLVMSLFHTSSGPLIPDFQLQATTSYSILYIFLLLTHSFCCLRGSAHMAPCLFFSSVYATSFLLYSLCLALSLLC